MTYNSLQGIFTTMIGFVTWPPYWSLIAIVASDWPRTFFTARLFLFSIIITSNDDPKPSTVISEQPPTGLIPRHIKSQLGLQSASQVTYITGKWVSWLITGF